MNKRTLSLFLLICHVTLNPMSLVAEDASNEEKPNLIKNIPSAPTEIDSDKMDFDLENHQAIFSGNVKVVDEKLKLNADMMIVQFDEENKLEQIEAIGNVSIHSADNRAEGGKALYDFKKGEIVLSANPVLVQGSNRVTGAEKIIYLRKEEKFATEGGKAKIVFFNDSDQDDILNLLKLTEEEE